MTNGIKRGPHAFTESRAAKFALLGAINILSSLTLVLKGIAGNGHLELIGVPRKDFHKQICVFRCREQERWHVWVLPFQNLKNVDIVYICFINEFSIRFLQSNFPLFLLPPLHDPPFLALHHILKNFLYKGGKGNYVYRGLDLQRLIYVWLNSNQNCVQKGWRWIIVCIIV